MNLLKNIGFGTSSMPADTSLPAIFDFLVLQKDFVRTDVTTIYKRILTDVLERTQGLKPELENVISDSCLGSEKSDGLVTLISKAMCDKAELFIVYDKSTKVVRKATTNEADMIKADYLKEAGSSVGFYLNFKDFNTSDMLKIYSGLEYCTVVSLHKSMNTAKALQFKMKSLRASVSEGDSETVVAQAKAIAKALGDGGDVLLDGEDTIETLIPDLQAATKSMDFIAQKQSFYLGVPATYLTGLAPSGLGDSGEGDRKAVERGLKPFFQSIIKPVLDSIFDSQVTFKTEDFGGVTAALMALKDFEITTDELISAEDKKLIIHKMFNLSTDPKDLKITKTKPVENETTD